MSDIQLDYILLITVYYAITFASRVNILMKINAKSLFSFSEPLSLISVITSFFSIIFYALSYYYSKINNEETKTIKYSLYYTSISFIFISVIFLFVSNIVINKKLRSVIPV